MMKSIVIAAVLLLGAGTLIQAEDAKANWTKHCTKCHGDTGKGDTKMGQKLKVKDYSDAKVQAELKDDEMFKDIKEGVKKDGKTVMKPFAEGLKDDEIKALVAHIRSFKK